MESRPRSLNLFRIIGDVLADMPHAASVRRLIPMAWPVFEVEHTLRVRLEEELGVVERHVLEAIARFGPICLETLAELMGLDADVVELVLERLERFPSSVDRESEGLSAPPDTLKRIASGHWNRLVTQPYAFFVNGPSGTLAPREMGQIPASHSLSRDLSHDGGVVRDSSGQKLDRVFWVEPSGSDGRADLEQILAGTNAEAKAKVGIPEGAVSVDSSVGGLLHQRWQLAIGELTDGGNLTIRPANRPDITLLIVGSKEMKTFGELMRCGARNGIPMLFADPDKVDDREMPREWHPHAACEVADGKLMITLRQPESVVFWDNDGEDEKAAGFGGKPDPEPPSATTRLPKSLRIALGRPFFWHPYNFALRQVHPGNSETAFMVLKFHGIEALGKLAVSDSSEPPDVTGWWNEFQGKVSANWSGELKKARIPLPDLLALARRSPDSDLVEFVGDIA